VVLVPFPGGHDFYLVTDGALIRRMLVDDQSLFTKGRALQAAKRLLGEGLLTSEGEEHLTRRRLIQPIFHSTMIDRYGLAMVAAADGVAGRWRHGAEVDINEQMMGFALAVVGRTIFDADVESEAPEIRAVLDSGMRVFHRFLLPGADLLWRVPLPATRRFNAAKADVDRMITRMIADRRGATDGVGLLDHLLALRDEDGRRVLTDEQIRDEAITLMLAGHETTAQALTWAWYLLARNPGVEHELVAELRTVLGDRPATAADYPRLEYTQAVVRESLRLYPPVWALARIAQADYVLGDVTVPGGSTIVTSQWVVQHAGEHWSDPLAFRPQRWLDGSASAPGTSFPFAMGGRMCIGERFAMLEAVLALATFARDWHVEPLVAEPQLDPRFTLRPRGGMPAALRRR
jgi:cytochrome P450